MTKTAWALLAALSLIWGSSFLLNEIALTALPPITVVTGRVVFAALTLFVMLKILGINLPAGRRNWSRLLLLGLFNNAIPFLLIVWGQTMITSGLASILNGTTPFFTAFLAHFLVGERLTPARIGGILLAIAGVGIIFMPSISLDDLSTGYGELALLGSSLSYAIAVVISRRSLSGQMKPVQIAFGQLLMSSMIMLPLAFMVDGLHTMPLPPVDVIAAVLALALVCGALAYIFYFRLIAAAGATNASLVTLTIPVVAVLLGILLLGEPLEAGHLIGMGSIGMGMLMLNGSFSRRRHQVKSLQPHSSE